MLVLLYRSARGLLSYRRLALVFGVVGEDCVLYLSMGGLSWIRNMKFEKLKYYSSIRISSQVKQSTTNGSSRTRY